MSHLTGVEFVDLLDGHLAGSRREHAEWCEACRSRAAALRAAMEQMSRDEVPDPSPLFWDHFSARVAEAVRAEPVPSRAGSWLAWTGGPLIRWSMAAAALAVVAGLSWNALAPRDSGTRPAAPIAAATTEAISASDGTNGWLGDPETDEAWAVVRTAADGLEWEEAQAAGITVRPGAAEHVAMALTPEERTELARLIEDELRRSGS